MKLNFDYRKRPLLSWLLLSLLVWIEAPAEGAGAKPWLLVDTGKATLSVMRGNHPELVIEDIAIGRFGTTEAKQLGDDRTPLGEFHIGWIKPESRFHRFIGLDYPNLEHARRGFEEGRLSESQLRSIERARALGEVPPQNTPLGGQIGLHGIGEGDPELHRDLNWTHGCIALTNEQIDRLLEQVELGTRVVIR